MAIQFLCSCGKQMQAKDEFAGIKLQCPKCAKIVRIPAPKDKEKPDGPSARAPMGASPKKSPMAAPVATAPRPAPPLARPVMAAPLAKPVMAKPLAAPLAPAEALTNPWDDRSLMQTATPWLPGDEARYQVGIKPMREGLKCWEKTVLAVLVIGGAAGAIVAVNFL